MDGGQAQQPAVFVIVSDEVDYSTWRAALLPALPEDMVQICIAIPVIEIIPSDCCSHLIRTLLLPMQSNTPPLHLETNRGQVAYLARLLR